MRSKNINTLKLISNDINDYLKDNNHKCVERENKNDIIDAIMYKMLYMKSHTTQEETTISLNKLKKKYKGKEVSSRQALAKKEAKLDISFYTDLSNKIAELINKHTIKDKYTRQIIAVDGVFSTFLKSLSKDGYKLNKNKESVTPLITGLFNVTYNMPICLELAKTKDERVEFMKYIKNKDAYKDNVFIFDRGYYSEDMVKFMFDNKLNFVFRLKKNSSMINDSNDHIVDMNGNDVRIITYIIDGKKYYMATNLYNDTISQIKSIYHDRWTIEEFYKFVKTNLCLGKMNEKTEINIKKSISAQLIISQITFLIVNMHKSVNDKQRYFKKKIITENNVDNYVLNKKVLIKGIFDDFLFKFFNNIRFTKYYLNDFFDTYIKFILTNVGKHNSHTCKRCNYRWYYKKHFTNAKANTT